MNEILTPIVGKPQEPTTEMKTEAKIEYAEQKTIADVQKEADEIFDKYKKAVKKFCRDNNIPERYNAKLTMIQQLLVDKERDRLLKAFQDEHRKFTQAYPLVLRFMIQSGEYNSTVFERFLKHMQASPYKTEDQYFTIYSEYAKMLYRHYHPRASLRDLSDVQENAKKALKKEKDEFEDLAKKYEKEFDERIEKANALKRLQIGKILEETMRKSIAEAQSVLGAVERVTTFTGEPLKIMEPESEPVLEKNEDFEMIE
jgi:hypothetical protein